MLKNYLCTSFKSIKRNPGFSIINITGLSLALVLVIMLVSWLKFELSYDRFHENAKKIYRVVVDFNEGKSVDRFAHTPAPLGEALKNEIPEIADYVRFGSMGRMLVNIGNEQFSENIMLTDPSVFRVFSFRLKSGNRETALANPGSVVINESNALKYFGNTNPVGRTIFFDYGDIKKPYIITGVIEDAPLNSQLQYTFICSFSEMKHNLEWGMWNYITYILASNDDSYQIINNKLPGFVKNIPSGEDIRLHIQPLLKIHLHSNLRSDLDTNVGTKTIYIAASVLLLVLFVTCINYMNLATARFTVRGKEAGIRKVSGASNLQLRIQFLSESLAVTSIAFLIALALCWFLFPLIKLIIDLPVGMESLIGLRPLAIFILLIILIAFVSGSYPAFFLSSVKPVSSLRSEYIQGKALSLRNLRRSLVIFQFFVSIVLIASTLIIRAQMSYIKSKDMGLVPEQVIVVPVFQHQVKHRYELFKKEILNDPEVLSASAMCYFPGRDGYNQNVWWEGLNPGDNNNMISWIPVDEDFIKTLKIEMIAGEDFPANPAERDRTYILNESAVKMTGWADPVGKQFDIIGRGRVIGVVKDFNFKSLHSEIEPVALTYYPKIFDNLMIRVSTASIGKTIGSLKAKWEELFPEMSFEYSFLSDDFQKMYEKDTTVMRILTLVAVLSLFISCIGLFGLVVFTTDSKTKEIGIRKISGSTSLGIIVMLNMEFVKWILISLFISIPIILLFMNRWLESFAYRINLNWWFFVSAGALTIIFTLLTISWYTWRIARKNPVDCLRHE